MLTTEKFLSYSDDQQYMMLNGVDKRLMGHFSLRDSDIPRN